MPRPRLLTYTSWEMSTIGHPLSDWSNLVHPYTLAASRYGEHLMGKSSITCFLPDRLLDGLPTRDQLTRWYAQEAGWDPAQESKWGDAFGAFRSGVIMQGIKARIALRQATSEKAQAHAERVEPFAEHTWALIEEAQAQARSKL